VGPVSRVWAVGFDRWGMEVGGRVVKPLTTVSQPGTFSGKSPGKKQAVSRTIQKSCSKRGKFPIWAFGSGATKGARGQS
jgi:hypothetical protein